MIMKTKIRIYFAAVLLTCVVSLVLNSCKQSSEEDPGFTFTFLTDIHLQPESNAVEGFSLAIEKVNELQPDFVITGGDLIMDALGQTFGRADSLYNLYAEVSGDFTMPVYNTLGNHELFGFNRVFGIDPTHPMYGDKLYEERLGKRYYAFDHKGWRFYILDSVDEFQEESYHYKGQVDSEQLEWLADDLSGVDAATPIVVSVHIPFITAQTQFHGGSTFPNSVSIVIENSKEVLDLFSDHNLKLVLQGHLHAYEDIYVHGIHFITAGAVSGRWWQGSRNGMEEGFLVVKVSGDEFTSEYIDYGWIVE